MVAFSLLPADVGRYLHLTPRMNAARLNFRISSLLYVIAIAALLAGWYVQKSASDRRFREHQAETESRLKQIWNGVHTFAETSELIFVSRAFKMRSQDSEFSLYLENELIMAMRYLWQHEDDVDLAWGDDTPATTNGNDILKILDCDSVDQFFDIAQEAEGYNGDNAKWFPEIHDPASAEFASFRDFVHRSFVTENVTQWGD